MNNALKRLLIIPLLLLVLHLPGTAACEAGNTGEFPLELARGEAVADPPAEPPERVPDSSNRRQQPRAQGQEQQGNSTGPGSTAKEPLIREFVPSEEIEAGQSVDFPADI